LKSVREAQAGASTQALLQQTTREADTLIRRKEFSAAVELLERAQAGAGHSPELDSLLQYAREQKREVEAAGRETAAYRAPSHRISRPVPSAAVRSAARGTPGDVAILSTHSKRKSAALWAGLVMVLLLVAGVAAWRFSGAPSVGRLEFSAAPWAEVVNVWTAGGKSLNLSGQTPMGLELPSGNYVIELRRERTAARVEVSVEPGKVARINYQFPELPAGKMVDELVSKY
jgi:hypothetical protein